MEWSLRNPTKTPKKLTTEKLIKWATHEVESGGDNEEGSDERVERGPVVPIFFDRGCRESVCQKLRFRLQYETQSELARSL